MISSSLHLQLQYLLWDPVSLVHLWDLALLADRELPADLVPPVRLLFLSMRISSGL